MTLRKRMKIVLLGDGGIGKRSVLDRFLENRFYTYEGPEFLHPSMRLKGDFFPKSFYVNEKKIELNLWPPPRPPQWIKRDTFIAQTFFKGVSGLILFYDLTVDKSLYNLEGWIEICRKNVDLSETQVMLVGCKADLEEDREVSKKKALEFAKKHDLKIDDVIECSAKTGENVDLIFRTIAKKIIERG